MDARRDDVTLALDLPIHKGEVFAGKYEVDRVLGSGGMGMVIRAKHMQLGEMVAIKFLLPGVGGVDRVARFEREARAAAKIKGDHVVRVIDLGSLENGTPYMVMEYLEGEDLDQRLRRRGRLAVDQVVDFMTQACEAMAEAHVLGIIHRDLKSSNLFVVRRPDGSERIKVIDFGIAKVVGPDAPGLDAGMTRTMAVMGSPTYMSPEQLKSTRDVDARTDIWALGVIVHELLTGKVPFDGDGLPELYVNITTGPPPRLDRPDVPEGLEAVIARCLEKAREKRYRNVAELALALAPFGPEHAADSADRTVKIIKAGKMWPQARVSATLRNRKVMAAAFASAAALAAFGVLRSCGETSHAGTSPTESPSRSETVEARVDSEIPVAKSR
jgi:serine/threonine-protein kinase